MAQVNMKDLLQGSQEDSNQFEQIQGKDSERSEARGTMENMEEQPKKDVSETCDEMHGSMEKVLPEEKKITETRILKKGRKCKLTIRRPLLPLVTWFDYYYYEKEEPSGTNKKQKVLDAVGEVLEGSADKLDEKIDVKDELQTSVSTLSDDIPSGDEKKLDKRSEEDSKQFEHTEEKYPERCETVDAAENMEEHVKQPKKDVSIEDAEIGRAKVKVEPEDGNLSGPYKRRGLSKVYTLTMGRPPPLPMLVTSANYYYFNDGTRVKVEDDKKDIRAIGE